MNKLWNDTLWTNLQTFVFTYTMFHRRVYQSMNHSIKIVAIKIMKMPGLIYSKVENINAIANGPKHF